MAFSAWANQWPSLMELDSVERTRAWLMFQTELVKTKAAEWSYAIEEAKGRIQLAGAMSGINYPIVELSWEE